MDSRAKKELRSLLRQARKDGRKPFAGYIKEGDGSIQILLLADASEFVYRRLKRFESELLASFQAKWPQYNIAILTVVPRVNNEDAREAIRLGGTFRVFRRERVSSRQNT
jgi:hypothetical protein